MNNLLFCITLSMSLISCKLDNKNTNQRTRSIIDYPVKFYNINSPYDTIIFESDSLGFLSNKSTKKDFTYWYSTDKDSLFISPYYSRDLWFKLTLFKDSLALWTYNKIMDKKLS